jgi:cytochrome c5
MMVALAMLWWLAAQAPVQEAPGAAIVRTRCTACHETDLIRSQRLSRAGWTRELDKMVRWGAQVPDADREVLLTYLVSEFGSTAERPVASAGAPSIEAIYRVACVVCHETDLIRQQRLTRAGWVREVDKMIRWGAQVPAADKDALIDFLAGR